MKARMLVLPFLGLLSFSCTSSLTQTKVPVAAQSGFAARFPEAAKAEWEQEGENFEVEYILNSLEYEAVVSPGGEVLMVKSEITAADLPQAVTDVLNQQHQGLMVSDVEKIQQGDRVYYQVELEKDNEDLQLVYTEDGQQPETPVMWE